ncbi:MAG: polymerase subunit beta protein [Candidatus Uhrbacteria bacterium GW2011_GWA2_53_10]|uniref:Polymerase subunit beta protein n=1 Tax=Candidatus Uhrbacteria bacterium GW2011_GWA2_53_10 TaxID=1618980 RepID=A0A0G1XQM0_9BACT|nr:MAG: polymerase subunit beta protein [Candidatus Uhrbacteria bacterium GW2011_GWA2_53_10]
MASGMSKPGFKLEQLFGSQTRARLLGLFLLHPTSAFFVRELTRKIGAQLNSVRRELKNLVELGLVAEQVASEASKKSTSLAEKKKYYTVNVQSILYEDLRSLFSKVQILLKQNLVQEIEQKGIVEYLVFTGRFLGAPVATDVLIVGDLDQKNLQKVMSQFETELGQEINYTLLPKEEFLYRRQVSDRFLLSILESDKVVMVNRLKI